MTGLMSVADTGLLDTAEGILDRFSDIGEAPYILLFFAKRVGGTQQPCKTAGHIPLTGYFGLSSRLNADHPAGFSKMIKVSETKNRTDGAGTAYIVVPSYY
jgi:hypothetical protein